MPRGDRESLDPFAIADIPSAEERVRSSTFVSAPACLGSKCALADVAVLSDSRVPVQVQAS
jgi:hypothetical protein